MTNREIKQYRKNMTEGTADVVDGQLIIRLPDKFLKLQSLMTEIYNKAEEAGEETFNKVYKELTKYCKTLLKTIDK